MAAHERGDITVLHRAIQSLEQRLRQIEARVDVVERKAVPRRSDGEEEDEDKDEEEDERVARQWETKGAKRVKGGKRRDDPWNIRRTRQKKEAWTDQEDELLVQFQAVYGNRWRSLARHIPGRTTNSMKSRWHLLCRRDPELARRNAGHQQPVLAWNPNTQLPPSLPFVSIDPMLPSHTRSGDGSLPSRPQTMTMMPAHSCTRSEPSEPSIPALGDPEDSNDESSSAATGPRPFCIASVPDLSSSQAWATMWSGESVMERL